MEEATKETVIVVHGTCAAPQAGARRWYRPVENVSATKGFTAKLDAALQERGSQARCWAHCDHADHGFHWSGRNSWVSRTRAAAELGNYVLNLRNKGWRCHIVAHSHGGNVLLEALPQITTALPSSASLGKIVTLGTPFMDTISPIFQSINRKRRFLMGLSRIMVACAWFILLPAVIWVNDGLTIGTITSTIITVLVPPIGLALFSFRRKSKTEPIFDPPAQAQPKFLAIGSPMDEPWQLLHHMRNTPNPMSLETNLIRYLISSMRSHVSQSRQIAQIYEAKSYRDIRLMAKLFLALTHLMIMAALFSALFTIYEAIDLTIRFGFYAGWYWLWDSHQWEMFAIPVLASLVLVLLFTRMFGTQFYSAFFAPFRWCLYRIAAINFRVIATYIVRSRGWSVLLAIAMGLEGYRHPLPLIEQYPSSVPHVKYENMPKGAELRALAMRGDWINRHFENVAQTFSKLVLTSADITLLLRTIEADVTLVHAAYYTDEECITRIADWIAEREDLPFTSIVSAEERDAA
ncbi:MAG TPA: hypothetical protein VH678_18545 [Xanthobacteraceae bacterium]